MLVFRDKYSKLYTGCMRIQPKYFETRFDGQFLQKSILANKSWHADCFASVHTYIFIMHGVQFLISFRYDQRLLS